VLGHHQRYVIFLTPGWIDPEVVKKINFISLAELKDHIPDASIPKFLRMELKEDGVSNPADDGYVFEYKGPVDEKASSVLEEGKEPVMESFQKACLDFLRGVSSEKDSRDALVGDLTAAYVKLEPFVRAKTHYHRAGFIV
jgi:hypothetical protein